MQKETSKKIGASPLSGFSEGHMGKLVVRKSGRTSLMLGNVVLDVSMGTKCGFLQVHDYILNQKTVTGMQEILYDTYCTV